MTISPLGDEQGLAQWCTLSCLHALYELAGWRLAKTPQEGAGSEQTALGMRAISFSIRVSLCLYWWCMQRLLLAVLGRNIMVMGRIAGICTAAAAANESLIFLRLHTMSTQRINHYINLLAEQH